MTGTRNIRPGLWLAGALILSVIASGCGGATPKEQGGSPAASQATGPAAGPTAGETTAATSLPGLNTLIVFDSVVRGAANLPDNEKGAKSCVLNSRFLHNEEIVWRVKVVDPKTGQPMDDSALASVTVKLPEGKTLEAKYAPHPKNNPTDSFWTASWEIPEEFPAGTLDYSVEAVAKDGRKGELIRFRTDSSALIIQEGSIPKLAKKG